MLYLSRLILNLRDRHARKDLADVHDLHRTVLGAFPQAPETVKKEEVRQHFGILFRTEPMPDQPLEARILVQSSYDPNWTHLPAGYLAPSTDERPNPTIRTIDDHDQIVAGMTLRFRLRANPTKRISKFTTEQKDFEWIGRRVELRREEDQIAWLQRKAEQGGFQLRSVATRPELTDVRISPQAKVVGGRGKGPDSKQVSFGTALFEGLLEVQDVELFRQTLSLGIGSGKAYGFGLLSIATLS